MRSLVIRSLYLFNLWLGESLIRLVQWKIARRRGWAEWCLDHGLTAEAVQFNASANELQRQLHQRRERWRLSMNDIRRRYPEETR